MVIATKAACAAMLIPDARLGKGNGKHSFTAPGVHRGVRAPSQGRTSRQQEIELQNVAVAWAMALFWGLVWPWLLILIHRWPLRRLMQRLIADVDSAAV